MCMDCFGEKFMQAFHLHLLLLCPSSFRRCAREGHLVGVITRTQERVRLPYMVNGSPLQICLQHGWQNGYEQFCRSRHSTYNHCRYIKAKDHPHYSRRRISRREISCLTFSRLSCFCSFLQSAISHLTRLFLIYNEIGCTVNPRTSS